MTEEPGSLTKRFGITPKGGNSYITVPFGADGQPTRISLVISNKEDIMLRGLLLAFQNSVNRELTAGEGIEAAILQAESGPLTVFNLPYSDPMIMLLNETLVCLCVWLRENFLTPEGRETMRRLAVKNALADQEEANAPQPLPFSDGTEPSCTTCGSITVRSGTMYKCPKCGTIVDLEMQRARDESGH